MATSDTPSPSAALQEAAAHHASGRFAQADEAYRRLLVLEPDNGELLHRLGVLAAQQGHVEEARRHLEAAVRCAPDLARAHNDLGNVLQLEGRFDEAIAAHERAIAVDPRNAKARFNLGVALERSGDSARAIVEYQYAIALAPDLAEAHHNLGLILRARGDLEQAAASFDRALALAPDDAGAHENLGAVRRRQGRLREAAASFRRAVACDPTRRHLEHLIAAYEGETTDAAPDHYVAYLFDNVATTFDEYLLGGLRYRAPGLLRAMLVELAGEDRRFRRTLDLGCGTGLAGAEFANLTEELWGVDLSEKMIEQARARGLYARLDVANLVDFLERTAETFDLFVAADVLVYVGALHGVFEAVARRSAPGASFLFSTEIADGGEFTLMPTGRYAHAETYVRRCAETAGFTVARVEQHEIRREAGTHVIGNCFLVQRA